MRLEDNAQGSIAPASKSSQPAYVPKIGGPLYNGALISVLWMVATVGLLVGGGLWASGYQGFGPNVGWSSSASPQPRPNPARPIVGRMASTTTDVNLRAAANKTSLKVGLAERGSRVRVLNIASDQVWYEVEVIQHGRPKTPMTADRGWLHSSFLILD